MNIILAAGAQVRWNNSFARARLPNVKQLVIVDGVPLIEHIQGKFNPAIVITRNQKIIKHCARFYKPEYYGKLLETLFHTNSLWIEKTTVLLGDVYYGQDTIKKIKDCKQTMFFGDRQEIYAFVFTSKDKNEVANGCVYLVSHQQQCKLWNLYRYMNDIPQDTHMIQGMFTFVSDSRDFDEKRQYIRWLNARNK